jgi:hypothetical protein
MALAYVSVAFDKRLDDLYGRWHGELEVVSTVAGVTFEGELPGRATWSRSRACPDGRRPAGSAWGLVRRRSRYLELLGDAAA